MIIILILLYAITVPLLGLAYGIRDITPSFWSLFILCLPIINTAVLVYLMTGYVNIEGYSNFIRELKEKRDNWNGEQGGYVRKEDILAYLRNEIAIIDFHLKAQPEDPIWKSQRDTLKQIMDKIKSL